MTHERAEAHSAYLRMADEALCRPAAPSDGYGHVYAEHRDRESQLIRLTAGNLDHADAEEMRIP